MADIQLTYFNFDGGRGEDARLALHIAGADFTDDRVVGNTWMERKPKTPFGGLPILTIAGKGELAHSNAVLMYLGTTYGLLPSDPWEAAQHNAILASVEEARHRIAGTGHDDEAVKKQKREAFASGWLQTWAAHIDGRIQGPFLGGADLSVADLKLFVFLSFLRSGNLDHVPTDSLDAYGKLLALHEAVTTHPRVADWYAKRNAS